MIKIPQELLARTAITWVAMGLLMATTACSHLSKPPSPHTQLSVVSKSVFSQIEGAEPGSTRVKYSYEFAMPYRDLVGAVESDLGQDWYLAGRREAYSAYMRSVPPDGLQVVNIIVSAGGIQPQHRGYALYSSIVIEECLNKPLE